MSENREMGGVAEWLSANIDVAGIVTFLTGALVLALLQLVGRGLLRARRLLRERDTWYQRLRLLRTDVTRAYFEQELRLKAAFVNGVSEGVTEYVYPHRWFFVQALTDSDDRVVLYAVTTRDEDFRPEIWPSSAPAGSHPSIPHHRLGEVTFTEVFTDYIPDGVAAFFSGATAPSFYEESFSFGNPGLYLTYLVGLNAAGHHFFDLADIYSEELFTREVRLGRFAADYEHSGAIEEFVASDHIATFRMDAKPNTYGVMGQRFPYDQPMLTFLGPDRTQVRTL